VEGPRPRTDAANPYWVKRREATATTERVVVRYIPLLEPLWMRGPQRKMLARLSVSRARGGTIFHVKPRQWKSVASFSVDVLATIYDQEAVKDIEQLKQRSDLGATRRKTLIEARVGQGSFRRKLLAYWRACAVQGCVEKTVLRASHMKPWKISSDEEQKMAYCWWQILTPSLTRAS
jgi:hypothetical protein